MIPQSLLQEIAERLAQHRKRLESLRAQQAVIRGEIDLHDKTASLSFSPRIVRILQELQGSAVLRAEFAREPRAFMTKHGIELPAGTDITPVLEDDGSVAVKVRFVSGPVTQDVEVALSDIQADDLPSWAEDHRRDESILRDLDTSISHEIAAHEHAIALGENTAGIAILRELSESQERLHEFEADPVDFAARRGFEVPAGARLVAMKADNGAVHVGVRFPRYEFYWDTDEGFGVSEIREEPNQ